MGNNKQKLIELLTILANRCVIAQTKTTGKARAYFFSATNDLISLNQQVHNSGTEPPDAIFAVIAKEIDEAIQAADTVNDNTSAGNAAIEVSQAIAICQQWLSASPQNAQPQAFGTGASIASAGLGQPRFKPFVAEKWPWGEKVPFGEKMPFGETRPRGEKLPFGETAPAAEGPWTIRESSGLPDFPWDDSVNPFGGFGGGPGSGFGGGFGT